MNYPQEQYNSLIKCLKTVSEHMDIGNINPHQLHYLIFQQFSEGQTHNWIYITPEGLKRGHQLTEGETATKLFPENITFELYPDRCNDNHIETAMKKALKELV